MFIFKQIMDKIPVSIHLKLNQFLSSYFFCIVMSLFFNKPKKKEMLSNHRVKIIIFSNFISKIVFIFEREKAIICLYLFQKILLSFSLAFPNPISIQ